MGRALGDILPLAVAVAIFPVPIIAVVLVLGSDRGTAKGVAFVLAWCIGLTAVGGVVLVLGGAADASDEGEPASWVNVLLLGLGLLLLVAAVRQWRGRPSGGNETPTPGWMRTIDEFTIAKAAGAGFALSALNPKNLLLTVAAAAEIAEVGLSAGGQVAAACLAPARLSLPSRSSVWPRPRDVAARGKRLRRCAYLFRSFRPARR